MIQHSGTKFNQPQPSTGLRKRSLPTLSCKTCCGSCMEDVSFMQWGIETINVDDYPETFEILHQYVCIRLKDGYSRIYIRPQPNHLQDTHLCTYCFLEGSPVNKPVGFRKQQDYHRLYTFEPQISCEKCNVELTNIRPAIDCQKCIKEFLKHEKYLRTCTNIPVDCDDSSE